MRRLLLQWGQRSGGLIGERRCAGRGARRIEGGDVSLRRESIGGQRTMPGVEYAKEHQCGGGRICKTDGVVCGRRMCKVMGVVGCRVERRIGCWFPSTPVMPTPPSDATYLAVSVVRSRSPSG